MDDNPKATTKGKLAELDVRLARMADELERWRVRFNDETARRLDNLIAEVRSGKEA